MAMNVIIDPSTDTTFYDSVRRLLGGVDDTELDNDDILDPAFFDLAELEIVTYAPCLTDSTISATDKAKGRLAMIHLIAAKLCPTMKGKVEYEVKTIDVSWKKKPMEYDDLQERLLGTIDNLLNELDCYDGEEETIGLFKVAPSKMGVKRLNEDL